MKDAGNKPSRKNGPHEPSSCTQNFMRTSFMVEMFEEPSRWRVPRERHNWTDRIMLQIMADQ